MRQKPRKQIEEKSGPEYWQGAILNCSNYSIISTDKSGLIKTFNNAAERMLGYSSGEMVGKLTPEVIHDKEEVALRAQELSLELGRTISPGFEVFVAKPFINDVADEREWTYIRKDGTRFPVKLSVTAIRGQSGDVEGFLGIAFDITEEKKDRIYFALQHEVITILASEQDFATAVCAILKLICKTFHWEVGELWLEGEEKKLSRRFFWTVPDPALDNFLLASSSISFSSGVGIPGIVWQTNEPLFISDLSQMTNFPRFQFAPEGKLKSGCGFPLYNGSLFVGVADFFSREVIQRDPRLDTFFSSLGKQLGVFITRKRAEDNLRRSQEQLEKISQRLALATESANIGVWEWDIQTNSLTWDPIMIRLYGIEEKDFSGAYDAWRNGLHPEDLERAERELYDGVEGKCPFNTTFRVIWPNRSIHHIRATAYVVRDEEGRPLTMVGCNWDVSEEKESEILKNEFISVVSHELRTPLTSIQGALKLLVGGKVVETVKQKALLKIALENCQRLVRLVSDLLDIQKIKAGKLEFHESHFLLSSLVEQAIFENATYAGQYRVSLKLKVLKKNIYIHTDRDRMMQVITNLLSNAVKFSHPGGEVVVAIEPVSKNRVRVSVVDRGVGISESFKKNIFKNFSQEESALTRSRGGTGLGLSICKTIIEKCGGTIGFNSVAGEGSTFYFELPTSTPSPN